MMHERVQFLPKDVEISIFLPSLRSDTNSHTKDVQFNAAYSEHIHFLVVCSSFM